jgi:hypothetical protein
MRQKIPLMEKTRDTKGLMPILSRTGLVKTDTMMEVKINHERARDETNPTLIISLYDSAITDIITLKKLCEISADCYNDL